MYIYIYIDMQRHMFMVSTWMSEFRPPPPRFSQLFVDRALPPPLALWGPLSGRPARIPGSRRKNTLFGIL